MHKENTMLKGQIPTLAEAINVHEIESKASRETIMRLVSEVSKEQKRAIVYSQDMDKLSKVNYFLVCMSVWFRDLFLGMKNAFFSGRTWCDMKVNDGKISTHAITNKS